MGWEGEGGPAGPGLISVKSSQWERRGPFVLYEEMLIAERKTGIGGRTGHLNSGGGTSDPFHLHPVIRAGEGSAWKVGQQGELRDVTHDPAPGTPAASNTGRCPRGHHKPPDTVPSPDHGLFYFLLTITLRGSPHIGEETEAQRGEAICSRSSSS